MGVRFTTDVHEDLRMRPVRRAATAVLMARPWPVPGCRCEVCGEIKRRAGQGVGLVRRGR